MSGTENRRLTRTTTLRLSVDEVVALRSAAEAQGLGPSALARVLVLRGIGRKVGPSRKRQSDLAQSVGRLLGELGHWGRNLNQLAARANVGGEVDARALADLRSAVERLATGIMALREAPDDPDN